MKIGVVRVSNFRCVGGLDNNGNYPLVFEPTDNLNLLIGPNGAGKTTLTKAIDLVLNADGRQATGLISEYDFHCGDMERRVQIEIVLTEIGTAQQYFESDMQFFDPCDWIPIHDKENAVSEGVEPVAGILIRFEAWWDHDDGEIRWHWVLPKLPVTEIHPLKELSREQNRAIPYFRIDRNTSPGAFTLSQGSSLGRYLRRKNFALGNQPDQVLPALGKAGCALTDESCHDCEEKIECIGPELLKLFQHVRDITGGTERNGLVPSAGARFGDNRSRLAATTIGLRNDPSREGEAFIPFGHLSSGERYALAFALATQRIATGEAPIIIAEEPETALYPAAVGKTLAELRNGAAQALVTSHSEAVLRYFALDQVFIMSRDGCIVKLDTALTDSGVTGGVRQDVERMMMPGEASALFADKVMIVEGPAEAIVSGEVERLCASISDSSFLAEMGWTALSVHGVRNMTDYANMLSALGIRLVALVDGDTDGIDAAEEISKVIPTFTYKATGIAQPVLEDALLYGLPDPARAEVLSLYYADSLCQGCSEGNETARCWSQQCKGKKGPRHKHRLQRTCLAKYRELKIMPPALESLAKLIDKAVPGVVISLPVNPQNAR